MANIKEYLSGLSNRKLKTFPIGSDVDKEEVFDYPYLTDSETIECIKEHERIMFIIRGPNSTMKAALSEMILTTYPSAVHCCADHYFSKTFSPPTRNKETLALSHSYCEKQVQAACVKNESPIIVQNTHIRKMELQKYLEFAALYNYTVVMAITLYKFDVSPEALEKNNPDGLKVEYFRRRLSQWRDIPPLFTGWFLSPNSRNVILESLQTTLSTLLHDGKFCRSFNSYDNDDILNQFDCRRNLYCIGGYTNNRRVMEIYYLSDLVQKCYGKSYFISILGYLITKTEVLGIVQIDEEMSKLVLQYKNNAVRIGDQLESMNLNDDESLNLSEYIITTPFGSNNTSDVSILLEEWENEALDLKYCKLIHLAQKKNESFSITGIQNKNMETVSFINDDMKFNQLEDIYVSRLPDEEWLVKLPKKIKLKSIFTGLYL